MLVTHPAIVPYHEGVLAEYQVCFPWLTVKGFAQVFDDSSTEGFVECFGLIFLELSKVDVHIWLVLYEAPRLGFPSAVPGLPNNTPGLRPLENSKTAKPLILLQHSTLIIQASHIIWAALVC